MDLLGQWYASTLTASLSAAVSRVWRATKLHQYQCSSHRHRCSVCSSRLSYRPNSQPGRSPSSHRPTSRARSYRSRPPSALSRRPSRRRWSRQGGLDALLGSVYKVQYDHGCGHHHSSVFVTTSEFEYDFEEFRGCCSYLVRPSGSLYKHQGVDSGAEPS